MDEQVGSVAFQPVFDATRGAGATIRRMLNSLFTELATSDSLLTNEIAIRSFEEHLALSLLLGLPHSHSERLLRQRAAAAPANVNRAEEFMRANAREPLTIEAIANAAGCSVRALQLAFRRFRGTTPMAALQRIRLEAARAEMLRVERAQSLARIAAEYGFSNPSRFAQLFRRGPMAPTLPRRSVPSVGSRSSSAEAPHPARLSRRLQIIAFSVYPLRFSYRVGPARRTYGRPSMKSNRSDGQNWPRRLAHRRRRATSLCAMCGGSRSCSGKKRRAGDARRGGGLRGLQ